MGAQRNRIIQIAVGAGLPVVISMVVGLVCFGLKRSRKRKAEYDAAVARAEEAKAKREAETKDAEKGKLGTGLI